MSDKHRKAAETIDRMLQDRIIFLGTPIDNWAAQNVLAQMLYLLDRDSKEPISIYLTSPGGSVAATFSILDGIDEATAPIHTICVGTASGTALLLLAHGATGCRFALPSAQFQMTQLSVGSSPEAYSEQQRLELWRMEELLVIRLAEYSGQPKEKIRSDMKAELFLDAYGAKNYGLIDAIVQV